MALVDAIRSHGHLAARLDPLGSEPLGDPALEESELAVPLPPDVQARIPASILGVHVEGDTLRRCSRDCARSTAGRSRTRSSTSPTTPSAPGFAA